LYCPRLKSAFDHSLHEPNSPLTTNLFPIWVPTAGALALAHPAWFTWFRGEFSTWSLAPIMPGMGITLTLEDYKRVLQIPRAVGISVAAHYVSMPFLG
jgi:BASS family bile acid:Na+ symporter